MLDTLEKKVEPGHTALVVVDVQNDFCAPGGMMAREGHDLTMVQNMVPRLTELIESARKAGVLVVYIQSIYGRTGSPYLSEVWLEQAQRRRKGSYTEYAVCEEGSWNFEFFGGIEPREDEIVVHKHRFSAFQGGDLDIVLRSRNIRTVVMTGVATNVCVETTAREAFVRDFHVVLVSDCSATYRQEDHDMTLRNIDNFFGEVVPGGDLVALWTGGRVATQGAGSETVG
jgi:ureidoacrylate peracid hydrolase